MGIRIIALAGGALTVGAFLCGCGPSEAPAVDGQGSTLREPVVDQAPAADESTTAANDAIAEPDALVDRGADEADTARPRAEEPDLRSPDEIRAAARDEGDAAAREAVERGELRLMGGYGYPGREAMAFTDRLRDHHIELDHGGCVPPRDRAYQLAYREAYNEVMERTIADRLGRDFLDDLRAEAESEARERRLGEPRVGVVLVNRAAWDAVRFDGDEPQPTPAVFRLPVGEHRLELLRGGEVVDRRVIEVLPSNTRAHPIIVNDA